MSQKNTGGQMMLSRQFWLSLAGMASTSLILYDWYVDRSASAQERYNRIENDYKLGILQILKIRNEFVNEMQMGLNDKDEISCDPTRRSSSLKMLSSKIWSIPTGEERGSYYTLDWGGSNYRVLRITFHGRNKKSESKQLTEKISQEYMTIPDANQLFDHLTINLKKLMQETKDRPKSPMSSAINSDGAQIEEFDLYDGESEAKSSNSNLRSSSLQRKFSKTGENSDLSNDMNNTSMKNNNGRKVTLNVIDARSGDENKRDTDGMIAPGLITSAAAYKQTLSGAGRIRNAKQSLIAPLPPMDFPTGVQGYLHFGNTVRVFAPDSEFPIGFCFSFPMRQPALDQGILVEWTKGFAVPGVVGKNVTALMHEAFLRADINARIQSVVNDTVGTLLACAYDNDNTRIGLILGTGSNAAYVEPERNDEIINIEWGNFNKHLPRASPDWIMDEYTPNAGSYYAEKMISGMYIGEMCRLLAIDIFREQITMYGEASKLNVRWAFGAHLVSQILEWFYIEKYEKILTFLKAEAGLKGFRREDAKIFGSICKLIVYRSADVATTLLTAVLERTGLYHTVRADERNPWEKDRFVLNEKYRNNDSMYVTVGIDGSVYHKCSGYAERIRETLENVLGREIADKVFMVHSEDGSGKGAALAAAGAKKNHSQFVRQKSLEFMEDEELI